eukprot:c21217_g2_i1.p1 GENE.c21217_g2_i1~~c21217_g2_i1.p1  ORF type:complete len:330 (+),score=133.41 c21217_g2_i1:333-1322(+)
MPLFDHDEMLKQVKELSEMNKTYEDDIDKSKQEIEKLKEENKKLREELQKPKPVIPEPVKLQQVVKAPSRTESKPSISLNEEVILESVNDGLIQIAVPPKLEKKLTPQKVFDVAETQTDETSKSLSEKEAKFNAKITRLQLKIHELEDLIEKLTHEKTREEKPILIQSTFDTSGYDEKIKLLSDENIRIAELCNIEKKRAKEIEDLLKGKDKIISNLEVKIQQIDKVLQETKADLTSNIENTKTTIEHLQNQLNICREERNDFQSQIQGHIRNYEKYKAQKQRVTENLKATIARLQSDNQKWCDCITTQFEYTRSIFKSSVAPPTPRFT